MGFFSWCCAKTYLPVLSNISWPEFKQLNEVALIAKKGEVVRGSYDGYGNINGLNLVEAGYDDMLDNGEAKLVLTHFYDPEIDTWDDLGPSIVDQGQGHFHKEDYVTEALKEGGFVSECNMQLAYSGQLSPAEANMLNPTVARTITLLESEIRRTLESMRRPSNMETAAENEIFMPHPILHMQIDDPKNYSAKISFGSEPDSIVDTVEIDTKTGDGSIRIGGRDYSIQESQAVAEQIAGDLTEAYPMINAAVIDVSKSGDLVGYIDVYRSELNESYYHARDLNGASKATCFPGSALDMFGIKQTRDLFEKIYRAGEETDSVEIDVPDAPSPGM